MIPALKSFLKALAFAYVSLLAGWLCGYPLVGLYVGAIPVMVGFLWLWDHVHETTKECWICGRNEMNGRHMYVSDWFKRDTDGKGDCAHCGRPLVKKGDRLYGESIGDRKAA